MDPLLEIKDLRISFNTDEGRLCAVNGVSLSVMPGQIMGLVGESGCGKSVTSMSILRLLPKPASCIESGEILYNNRDLLSLDLSELKKIRGREIGVIFQEPMTALSPLNDAVTRGR